MCGAITPLPQYAFMAGAQLKQRGKFTFIIVVIVVNDG
jgi:hypothetical protein